jgi:hypothetical protein
MLLPRLVLFYLLSRPIVVAPSLSLLLFALSQKMENARERRKNERGRVTRFTNSTKFLIKNFAYFLLAQPSGTLPLACPLT